MAAFAGDVINSTPVKIGMFKGCPQQLLAVIIYWRQSSTQELQTRQVPPPSGGSDFGSGSAPGSAPGVLRFYLAIGQTRKAEKLKFSHPKQALETHYPWFVVSVFAWIFQSRAYLVSKRACSTIAAGFGFSGVYGHAGWGAPKPRPTAFEHALWRAHSEIGYNLDFNKTIDSAMANVNHPYFQAENGSFYFNQILYGKTPRTKRYCRLRACAPFAHSQSVPHWSLIPMRVATNGPLGKSAAETLYRSIMLAHAWDAFELMYDSGYTFQSAYLLPKATTSRPSTVVGPGVIPPIYGGVLFAIWAVGYLILGWGYGFRRRWSEMSRLEGDFAREIQNEPDCV
ncbi:hypothetical protein GX50_01022 [[Emmonsia] crescens]|uniref:Uncharacterized protein n=1 Tax=[Emmonsia] crescens TaxID=73230 RepID=A0A2B7ZQ87_9EURO|nr:hypothetical protein GX50_01022 [Emmonsia crescens]